MGGYNQEESHKESQWSQRTDVLLENLPSLSGSTGTASVTDSFDEYAIRGLFYRVNYTYDGKYMFEANGRYDGTSRFPKDSRFGFFPSFSAGWRISEEAFMKNTKSFLSNLKLRASWGSIGNQIILKPDNTPDNYPYIPSMSPYLTEWLVDGQKTTTLNAPAMVSSSFSWEKVYTLDFGVDFGFFDNRFNGTFDWYRRDTKGMLAPGMDLPWVVGATAAKQNAADLKTYGWELELNWRDRINKDWSYRIGFNLYDSQSEITKYNNETNLLGDKIYRKGMKMGEIWGYVTDRFYTEDDFNADGTLKPGIPIPKGAGKVFPGKRHHAPHSIYAKTRKQGMKKTGIGLIGADFSLRAALIEYNYPREKAEMAAVCDRNPAMLELYRREHPDTKAHLYATYQELIADPDVDAVCVMVRDQYHEEIAVAALEAHAAAKLCFAAFRQCV